MKKGAIVIILMLFIFPAIALPTGTLTDITVLEESNLHVVSEAIEPPEGIVSWWTGDDNDYDYVGTNHGTILADTSFVQGLVDEAFSFDGDGDSVYMGGAGIDQLQEFSMECWVKHNTQLEAEINRYVTLSGEKAVIRHDSFNLHFYMSFLIGLSVYPDNELKIPVEGYNPFTNDPIDPDQFSFLLIEGLEPGSMLYMTAEFTNGDSDFMVWPADMPIEDRTYQNNLAGNGLSSARVPEAAPFWLPMDCDSIIVGCFDFDRQTGYWTINVNEQIMEHISVPYIWEEEWFHHVAATYDSATMRLYMDGGLVGEQYVGLEVAPGSGVELSSDLECLDGLIDEVTIYNRALNDWEILSIYEAGSDGKIKPEDQYYQYSKFSTGTNYLTGVGGYVEDYGDPDVWGDEVQYLYCVGDTSGFKIRVWLTDYEKDYPGEDTLSPGWIEPHQHPDNPDATGPIEPRHFEIVSSVELSYDGIMYTDGAMWHSDEFHADERGIFLGTWPYGIFRFNHSWNDDNADGFMDYPAEQIAYPPSIPPDPNMGRTETLAYNPDDNIWYAGERCLGWEYRNIWELVDTDEDDSFLDEQWTIAFSYPALMGGHHDGLEYAAGCLWISDMTSDIIAQWEKVDGVWVERNIFEYTAAAFVEGMGFGPNDHLWATSLRYEFGQEPHLYEFGGGALQQELATPVYVDIKPASWPNPINTKDKGVLPIAICGTPNFDVHSIDPASVTLGCYFNDELVYPLRWSYQDVATPYLGEPGGGHALDGDGYIDLVLHFDAREVIETLNLAINAGEVIPLIITADDLSPLGAHFRGIDYVWILDQQGIFGPPEFLRFFEGNLDALVDGSADLSSATIMVNPYEVPYPDLLDDDEFHFVYTERNGYGLNTINCEKYPLSITEFRQALAYALDKHATSGVWGINAQPHDSFISIANPFCEEGSLPVNYYDANLVLGNQLLDDAGFLDIDSDGFREAPDKTDFDVVVEYAGFSAVANGMGEIIVQTLQELGINAVGLPHDSAAFIETLENHEDFDMAFFGFNFGFDIVDITEFYISSNADVYGQNYANFRNDNYDFWWDQLQDAVDYSAAQEAAFELQKIMAYECPIIVCYENYMYSAARRPLENYQISAIQGMTTYETFVNLEGIYPEFETVNSAVVWPGTLNPFRSPWWDGVTSSGFGFNPLALVYESLARLDINGNLMPQLAKTIDWNPAGQYIDIVLNKDLMWHDGKPFSPWDISFTFDYMQVHPVDIFTDPCSHVTYVEVLGDKQLRIYLDQPSYWTFEELLRVPILPEHLWWYIDDPYSYANSYPIGTGPFAFYEFYGELYHGDTNMDLAGRQLVSASKPEVGSFWTPEDGNYMIGVDFYGGNLPLEYSITMTYDGITEVIMDSIDWSDVITTGNIPPSIDEIEKVHYVWLPAGVEVTVVVDWNTEADLDIFFWSPSTIFSENLGEIILRTWPWTTNLDVDYSIGHFYPAPAPYLYQPYHVLQTGTTLTIGYGLSAYGVSEELAVQNLQNRIDGGLVVIEIDGKPVKDANSAYLWEYLAIEYVAGMNLYRAYVPYRYYLKALPAGGYEIYWRIEDPIVGVVQTVGYVTWVKG